MTELERFVRQGHRVLLLTSYCGDDDSDCTDTFPCDDCLKMCNVAEIRYDGVEVLGGLDYLRRGGYDD